MLESLIKVSSDDQTSGYLEQKVIGTPGNIVVTVDDPGGDEDLQIEISSFIDMANWVKDKLTTVIPNKKPLRLKVVYNAKGFTTTSHNGIFVEPMDVAESKVEKLPRDRFERPVIKADQETVDPLAKAESTPATSTEDTTNATVM